jgi:hypothetical protein
MSSKSRKQSAKQAQAQPAKRVAQDAPATAPAADAGSFDIPEKYLKAPPRKMSRLSYGFLIFFLIFVLVAWVGGGLSGFTGMNEGGDRVFMTWNRPSHGRTEVMWSEFQRDYDAFEKAFRLDFFLRIALGVPMQDLEPQDVARLMALAQIAEDEGIVITDDDLGQHLAQVLDTQRLPRESYEQVAQSLGGVEFLESTLRRLLGAQRLLHISAYAGAASTPAGVEALWKKEHEELAFDYVEVAAEDFADEARAEVPDDAALEAWLAEQAPAERSTFELPERRAFEVASFRDPATTPAAGLLQAFPPAEGADPEERASDYYGRVYSKRFRKAEPDVGPPSAEGELPQYRSYEEVHDACLVEAPIHEALQAWLAGLQARVTAGTAVDLAAEAGQHGLEFTSVPASTQAEFEENAELGKAIADVVFFTPPESFAYTVTVTADRIGVVRVRERVEPVLPPFAEIRERVVERWIEVRSAVVAEEKLRALWNELEVLEAAADAPAGAEQRRKATEEAFRAAVEAKGLAVARRDWLDKGGNPGADPLREERAHEFLARRAEYQSLEEGEVAEPRASDDGDHAYLVRLAGKRPVPIEQMNPGQYAQLKQRSRERALSRNVQAFDFAFLERNYGLVLPDLEKAEAAEAAETPDDGGDAPAQPGN